MTIFSDSIIFLVNGVSKLAHSGDTIQISRNLTIAAPSLFQVGVPINFTSDNTTPILTQIIVPGTVGQNLTIQAQAGQQQSGANVNNDGGDLLLSSGAAGTGGSGAAGFAGSVQLQVAGTTIAEVDSSKFYLAKGFSRHVTQVTASYQVLTTDDVIAVGSISSSITVTLPSSPNSGDTYMIKDTTGVSFTYNVTVLGNGNNIDGSSSYIMADNFECIGLTFTNSGWSVT